MALPAEVASKLAYYKAENAPGVLAPRDWRCFGTYGSSGSSLYVTPVPIDTAAFFTDPHAKFYGPAIQLSFSVGDTSGRFEVAQIIARLFPAHRDFAIRVHDEHLLPDTLPSGPPPTDKLHYLTKEAVEYTTPPNLDGEGTQTWLVKNDEPITGVVLLTGEEFSATHLAVRLTSADASLAPFIIHQVEHDAAAPQP